ncbi:MAG: hypothetical protein IJE74_08515 [Clostridia bacterium]|nr:hypothetical protein [Clostridia bacterium]
MKKKGFTAAVSGIIFFAFLFTFPKEFSSGFTTGLVNCGNVVIPSLFPFLVASSLAGSGELPKALKKVAEPITHRLFHLPADALPAIILGQLGGYLSGAKAVDSLYSSGIINRTQAQKLLLFCVNSGIGFSVNAVGNALLSSRKAGRILLISLCISSILIGFLIRFIPDKSEETKPLNIHSVPFSSAVVNSVSSAASAMLGCCGFVCIFSGISAVTSSLIKNQILNLIFGCILEVTSGCASAACKVSLPVIAAACAFGGLCVHMQIISVSRDFGINLPLFFLFRILHSAFAYAVCRIILYFHPIEEQVFISVSENIQLWSFSAPAAISLLFLCSLLILDLDNNKKIC